MPDILLSFKRLTLRWAFISIVSTGGLGAVYAWRHAEHIRAGLTFYLGIGLILASGLGFGIGWYALRSARLPARKTASWLIGEFAGPRLSLLALFYLAQIIAGILLVVGWLNLRLFSSSYLGQLPLLFWLLFSALAAALFLIDIHKNDFRLWLSSARLRGQDALRLILPGLTAILVGMSANNLMLEILLARRSRYATLTQFTTLADLGWPLIAVDLVVLLATAFPSGQAPAILKYWRDLIEKLRALLRRAPLISHPPLASLLTTLVFFTIIFTFFRIGYEVVDDGYMALVTSGYMGGQPAPYLIHSNVLVGLFLLLFFQLRGPVNWGTIFFLALHFLSLWTILGILYSRPVKAAVRALAVLVVLGFEAYFIVNITYTTTAAFASLAGFCLLFTSLLRRHAQPKMGALFLGGALIFAGSLVRFDSLLVVLAVGLPLLAVNYKSFKFRKTAVVFLIVGAFVAGGYGFDRVYIQSSPDWYAFDRFDQVRTQLLDTPRILNGTPAVFAAIGWSQNDVQVFRNWFFLDPAVFDTENFQYLVNNLSDSQGNVLATLREMGVRVFIPANLLYLLLFVLTLHVATLYSPRKATLAFILAATAVILLLTTYFVWKMKLPPRVLLPMLATGSMVILCLIDRPEALQVEQSAPGPAGQFIHQLEVTSILVALFVSLFLGLKQTIQSSANYALLQSAYHENVAGLDALAAQGTLQPNALVVSPMLGFPFEWSNPLTLEYPDVQFLSLGWLATSPPNQQVLDQFHIQSLPRALYRKDGVYLMARYDFIPQILKFIQEHYGVTVTPQKIYTLPADLNVPYIVEYQNISIYKLSPQ